MLSELTERFFSGSGGRLALRALEVGSTSREDLAAIRGLINEKLSSRISARICRRLYDAHRDSNCSCRHRRSPGTHSRAFLLAGFARRPCLLAASSRGRKASLQIRYLIALVMLTALPICAVGTFFMEAHSAALFGSEVARSTNPQAIQLPPVFHSLQLDGSRELEPLVRPLQSVSVQRIPILRWIDLMWLAGCLVLIMHALWQSWRLRVVRRSAASELPNHVHHAFVAMLEKLRIAGDVGLQISDQILSPLASGIWRKVIIVPASSLLVLDPDELEAILCHELAHLQRWDYAVNLAQVAIETLLFFHPVVWWISADVRERDGKSAATILRPKALMILSYMQQLFCIFPSRRLRYRSCR